MVLISYTGVYPLLTWYWYPGLGYTPFLFACRRSLMFTYCLAGAYPLISSWFRRLIFLLIRVIYWHFLDAILGFTHSPFELFAPQVHRRLFDIVYGSSIISVALRHHDRIPYLFDDSSTSCPNLLSLRQLSGIVSKSLIFSTILRYRARIPYLFGGSSASCLKPLSFRWLSGIVSRSSIFFTALRHRVRIPYLFSGFPRSCPDLISFRRLSNIMSGSPIFSTALGHHV